MGVIKLTIYDDDRVSDINIPNQFYATEWVGVPKTEALSHVLRDFANMSPVIHPHRYSNEPLDNIVIVATDSMASRSMVWSQFKNQESCGYYIEARMGAQLGMLYCIQKKMVKGKFVSSKEDIEFYESMLYSDDKVKPLPCTAQTIIYNVLMLASLVGKSVANIANNVKSPREQIFDMEHIHNSSFMIRE